MTRRLAALLLLGWAASAQAYCIHNQLRERTVHVQQELHRDRLREDRTLDVKLKPGARHERHRHHNCDEFFIVLKGHGHIYGEHGDEPSGEGDVVYSPRGCWHGFNNTSNEDVVLVWGWMGAGSIEDSGYEVHPESHK